MYKVSYIILSLLILNSCNYEYIRKNIVIKQIPCNESILLLRDTIKNEIDWIVVPYEFEMYKTCLWSIAISSNPFQIYYGYNGNSRYRGVAWIKYLIENNKLFRYSGDEKQYWLYFNKPRTYRISGNLGFKLTYSEEKNYRKTSYSDREKEQFLKPYLDSMNKLYLDTLRIGSIAEVQRTNPKFFDYFIKGDSVFINFYNKRTGILRKYIPIEIK